MKITTPEKKVPGGTVIGLVAEKPVTKPEPAQPEVAEVKKTTRKKVEK